MWRDVCVRQTALDCSIQQEPLRLIDAAHNGGYAVERRRDRSDTGYVDLASDGVVPDCRRNGVRLRLMSPGDKHTVVARQMRRDAPAHDAVTACDEN